MNNLKSFASILSALLLTFGGALGQAADVGYQVKCPGNFEARWWHTEGVKDIDAYRFKRGTQEGTNMEYFGGCVRSDGVDQIFPLETLSFRDYPIKRFHAMFSSQRGTFVIQLHPSRDSQYFVTPIDRDYITVSPHLPGQTASKTLTNCTRQTIRVGDVMTFCSRH